MVLLVVCFLDLFLFEEFQVGFFLLPELELLEESLALGLVVRGKRELQLLLALLFERFLDLELLGVLALGLGAATASPQERRGAHLKLSSEFLEETLAGLGLITRDSHCRRA